MKKRDMIVRQGIKTTAKSHKMLVPYVNGEMTFNGLFEDNHKTWKVGSKEYNKMAKIPFEDLEPQDQITKYNLISMGFTMEICSAIKNNMEFIFGKFLKEMCEDENIKEVIDEYNDSRMRDNDNTSGGLRLRRINYETIIEHLLYFIVNSGEKLSRMRYVNTGETPKGLEILTDINTFMTRDETIIEDCTCVAVSYVSRNMIDMCTCNEITGFDEFADKLMSLVHPYLDDILRACYDAFYIIFSKAYYLTAQYYNFADYPSVLEKLNGLSLPEDNTIEDGKDTDGDVEVE